MTAVELGAVRQIWLAPHDDPTDKSSFLIRDDAYSRSGATFGRTLRLGDPVDLGPNSTWRQTTWEGGRDQELWNDSVMYHKGNLDGTRKPGKLKMWPGWKERYANLTRAATRWIFASSAVGDSETVKLYMGESNPYYHSRNDPTTGTPTPTDGFKLWRYDPVADTTSLVKNFTGQIQAIARLTEEKDDAYTWLVVGDSTGAVWTYNEDGDVWYQDLTSGQVIDGVTMGATGWQSICGFNDATYLGLGNTIVRRTKTGPLISDLTYSVVQQIPRVQKFVGMEVWNGQLWIAAVIQGNATALYVTDGTTVRHVIDIPEEFHAWGMKAHYGSLYLSGLKYVTPGGVGHVGVVWRYTGASIQKLWQDGEGTSGDNRGIYNLTSWRQYLAWGRHSSPQTDDYACVMLYDAEKDAIIEGPGVDEPTGSNRIFVAGLGTWNDMLVAAFLDKTDYDVTHKWPHYIATVRTDENPQDIFDSGTVGLNDWNAAGKDRWLYTSVYDGEIPGEEKVWLNVRTRIKTPTGSSVSVYAIFDEDGTENLIQAWDSTGGTGWRTVVAKVKVAGAYTTSTVVQLKVVLTTTTATETPQVDTLMLDFMPAPRLRRQWRFRCVCTDGQLTLAGTANPLTTATAMADKIEELWSSGVPVLLWGPSTDGTTPVSAGTEVMLTDFLDQPVRVASDETGLYAEVSFGALEVVT